METLIWIRNTGKRFINYDSNNTTLPEDASYITITDLPEQLVEAIREATLDQVDSLLSKYI